MCKTFNNKIIIDKDGSDVYFHVLGDPMRYFDIVSLEKRHPELSAFLALTGSELTRSLMQVQEANSL